MKQQEDLRQCSYLKCFLTKQFQKIKSPMRSKEKWKVIVGVWVSATQSNEMIQPAIVELPDFLFALPQSLGVFQQLELWIKLLHQKTAGGDGGGVISWGNCDTSMWEGFWSGFGLNLETKVHLGPYFVQMAYSAQERILHPCFPCCTMEYDAMHSACHSSDPVLNFCNAFHTGESWHVSQAAVYVARIRHVATSGVED